MPQAKEFLEKAMGSHPDDPNLHIAAYSVYKKDPEDHTKALEIATLMTEKILEKDSSANEKKLKQIKEYFEFSAETISPKLLNTIEEMRMIRLTRAITDFLKQESDKILLDKLSGFLVKVSDNVLQDQSQLNDCMAIVLPWIMDIKLRDDVMYNLLKEKELLSKDDEILQVLLENLQNEKSGTEDSQIIDFLCLKFGVFLDLNYSRYH